MIVNCKWVIWLIVELSCNGRSDAEGKEFDESHQVVNYRKEALGGQRVKGFFAGWGKYVLI